ncbi:hypothetical protein AG74_27 [Vibrio phage AG74]|uniref:Tail assembly chaperone n=1 Tax=Vibrio phage AG74 TaxID=2736261 RepID=A0A6M9Z0G5_9CAUD|nr:hypothetical protein KNV06_gp027 [Vibrio phage AG74]QKN84886.1 hypothetical protein AG74_27 [Vibrio phage AG74]WBU77035.1 hypothetical protein NOELLE_29 [Vibrio phage Noelle]
MKLSLSALALNSKTAEFDFPGIVGFKVRLTYLSREARRKIQEKCKVQKYDENSGLPYMDLDVEKYTEEYVKATINGWTGLTLENVANLMLIDQSQVEDPKAEIDFDIDTATQLVKLSEKFDNWVSAKLAQIENFRN